ncbi:MAG: hypothetical protein H7Z14_18125 [Anaerolineae bacterium]|nr:hypothetical protein [Phycisphaerae bacterium]
MKRSNSISWIEILLVDLALILAIGAMGASKRAETLEDVQQRTVASNSAATMLASR